MYGCKFCQKSHKINLNEFFWRNYGMQTEQFDTNDNMKSLLLEFEGLTNILADNSYVRDTTARLNKLLEDANSNVQVLLIGKERVGKSSVINALLGRDLLPVSTNTPTEVNTFIKFGEDERVVVHFYDGTTATFSLEKLALLTSAQNEISEIIHEHIDYLTVYVNHSFLKKLTLIDTNALERVNKEGVYFSHQLLSRANEICWIIRGGSPMPEGEIEFLQKVSQHFSKPVVIVNKTDQMAQGVNTFIKEEAMKYGHAVTAFYTMSAYQAFEAKRMNNTQQFIDSNITAVQSLFESFAKNKVKKTELTLTQLSSWLNRLQLEIKGIPEKEPYVSAISIVKQQVENAQSENLRMHSDLAIIKTYEKEYEEASGLFKEVQTLYQLLQTIQTHLFLRDEQTEKFEEVASTYLQTVRSYRTVHAEHVAEWNAIKKYMKKAQEVNGEQVITLTSKVNMLQMNDKLLLLNDKKAILDAMHQSIQQLQQEMMYLFHPVKEQLMQLLNQRLSFILQQVHQLNEERANEYQTTVAYVEKLHEFDCIQETQLVLYEQIKPIIEQLIEQSEEPEPTLQACLLKIQEICLQSLPHEKYMSQVQLDESLQEEIKVDFLQKFPVLHLELSEHDILSDLPEIPLKAVLVE